jgi:hypothetical protein
MKNDDELLRRLRDELDELVDGIPQFPASPAPASAAPSAIREPSGRRWMPVAAAAATIAVLVGGLVVIANRSADDADSDAPPVTTAPTVPPSVAPPSTSQVVDPGAQRYETVTTVLESPEHGPELCLGGVAESLPPQCGGPSIEGWSWDSVEGVESASGTTWGEFYVAGTWDPERHVFTVAEARAPTDADRERVQQMTQPDFSVPCPVPEGGWPARNQEWPGDQIMAIDGYAGAWVDPSQQVMTVKFTGDLAAAESAVRALYSDALCVVPATHTEAELLGIQGQLMAMSSVQFMWSAVVVDATGEWVEAGIIAPDPERQAAFDAEWGPGVVRLVSQLRPI